MEAVKLPHDHGDNCGLPLAHMPEPEDFSAMADIFKLLGDSSRLRIFWLLCHCEVCVANLSAMVRMSSPAVSHHLKLLRSYGLVSVRRGGKEVYYKASETPQAQQLHDMIERQAQITCPGI